MGNGLRSTLLPSVLAIVGACAAPPAATSGRIPEPIDPARVAIAEGNLSPLALAADDEGRMDGATVLPGISLAFALSTEQAANLATLLAQQQDVSSPSYHKWLTPDEYGARFGLSRSDLAKVVAWLEGEGFTVQRIARSATEITLSGTAAQVEATFHTEMHRYRIDGEAHFAMARAPSVPEALAGVVVGFRGLDDLAPGSRRPFYTLANQHHVAPEDFTTIYDVQKLYANGIDGTGVTIAITGQTYYTPSDIVTFRSLMGLPPIDLQSVLVPSSGTASFVDANTIGEAELDIQLSGAIAKNAKIIYVYTGGAAGYSIRDALAYAVDNKVADIVSISAGFCERSFTAAGVTAMESVGNQANAEGVTIVASSGDSGAAGCDFGAKVATKGLAVDLPSTLPQVTAVGGTEFDEGAGTYWSATNDASYGSALSYIPETAWNDVAALNSVWAGGGGVSTLFTKPTWQAGSGVPNDGHRDVPDVALSAAFHDARVVYWSPPAATNGTGLYFVYGTSVAAPSFAGILALVEQATGAGALGNVNPMLYALAAQSPAAFHDVTTGSNIVPCTQGTTGCPATAPFQYGFDAGPGYDLATGLGSIDAFALVNAWKACAASSCLNQGTDAGTADAAGNDAGGSDGAAVEAAAESGGSDAAVAEGGVDSGGSDAAVVEGGADSGAHTDAGATDSGKPSGADAASFDAASDGGAGDGVPEKSGCGCKVAGAADEGGTGLLALGAPLALLVRRRRRTVAST